MRMLRERGGEQHSAVNLRTRWRDNPAGHASKPDCVSAAPLLSLQSRCCVRDPLTPVRSPCPQLPEHKAVCRGNVLI
ncbi:hypothetical protein UY3_12247 [Chelonia mydas]|uniref:Uncharacterized protein n=1 Tax=Chelonia mydas TaxID=8469 RepID=M7BR64_CHEMY|nr:hypothetical protein UY3_12247 [Chelonia mydas]